MLNLQYSLLVAPPLFILISSVHSGLGGLAIARLKTLVTSKMYSTFMPLPPETLCTYVKLCTFF